MVRQAKNVVAAGAVVGFVLNSYCLDPFLTHRLLRADRRDDAKAVLTSLRCKKDTSLVDTELVALETELGASLNQPPASWSEVSD